MEIKFPELLNGAENDSLGGSVSLGLCLVYVQLITKPSP